MENIYGLDYLTKLSLSAIDRSDSDSDTKRNLLYSVYCFRCLFDNGELINPDPILVKHKCCFVIEPTEHPDYEVVKDEFKMLDESGECALSTGGVYIEVADYDHKMLKFDAGSPLWRKLVKKGTIVGEGAVVPDKFPLYEMVYRLLTLSTTSSELISMWYIFFPYIIMIDAPHEADVYLKLKDIVLTEDNFRATLDNKYSDIIYPTTKEMVLGDVNPIVIDWYIQYVEWKNVKNDKGISRELEKYQKQLALNNFEYVVRGTEKMLDAMPDNEDVLLINIAARVNYAGSRDEHTRKILLEENLVTLRNALRTNFYKKKNYLAYYLGMSMLGLHKLEEAKNSFRLALDYDNNFELAQFMLKAIDRMEKDN